MVTYVTPEEDEGVGGGSCAHKTTQVTDCVAGAVKKIKGAVAKVVKGGELANREDVCAIRAGGGEVDFSEVSTPACVKRYFRSSGSTAGNEMI